MSQWSCPECGSTDVWELSWVRANRISWMMEYDEDVRGYTEKYPQPQSKCMDCGELINPIKKEDD